MYSSVYLLKINTILFIYIMLIKYIKAVHNLCYFVVYKSNRTGVGFQQTEVQLTVIIIM